MYPHPFSADQTKYCPANRKVELHICQYMILTNSLSKYLYLVGQQSKIYLFPIKYLLSLSPPVHTGSSLPPMVHRPPSRTEACPSTSLRCPAPPRPCSRAGFQGHVTLPVSRGLPSSLPALTSSWVLCRLCWWSPCLSGGLHGLLQLVVLPHYQV